MPNQDTETSQIIRSNSQVALEQEVFYIIAEQANAQAYRNLIAMMLTYPHKLVEILHANQNLIDSNLIEMMEQVAMQMSKNGAQEAAALLRYQSAQLSPKIVTLTGALNPNLEKSLTIKPKFRWAMFLAVLLLLAGGITLPLYSFFNSRLSDNARPASNAPTAPKVKPTVDKAVSALGYIQPKDDVISLSGSFSATSDSAIPSAKVAKIFVKEGEQIRRGQLIAVLDNLNQLQASLNQAKLNVKVASAELAQVKAGQSKQAEISAQKAAIANLNVQFQGQVATQKTKIASLEAELKNAQNDYQRFEFLKEKGAISASEFESKGLKVTTLKEQLNEAKTSLNQILSSYPEQIAEAKANLEKLKEVRPVDVQVAQANVEKAIATIPKAEADLNLAYVRSPVDGQVLKINTFAGESISNKGIVDLAQTQEMYVVAEVYETDIRKIRQGQKAIISSSALTRNLTGTVEQIGSEIGKKDVVNNDPTLEIDARVVKVKIRLAPADTQQAAKLINLQVDVKIIRN